MSGKECAICAFAAPGAYGPVEELADGRRLHRECHINLIGLLRTAIAIDESGADLDTLEILVKGEAKKVLFQNALALGGEGDWSKVRLADGTSGFTQEDVQLAFQEELIAKTGRCVLEEEYHRAGFPGLAAMARAARGA